MTALFEQAIASVRDLPDEAQDALARLLLGFTRTDQSNITQSDEEAASFDESLAQADCGEFASDDDIHAIWSKHGL